MLAFLPCLRYNNEKYDVKCGGTFCMEAKVPFENPEFEIIRFSGEDVIIASVCPADCPEDGNFGPGQQLPDMGL